MKIAIGSDHRGVDAVRVLTEQLVSEGHEVLAVGECNGDACDYPDSAYPVADAVRSGDADRGILICGSGIGMSMAANKMPGVRAALVHDRTAAEMSRRHNDANVLCLSADRTPMDELGAIVGIWMATDFEGGRHQRRVDKIHAIERGEKPVGGVA